MAKQTYLKRRGAVYYFRIRIPNDVAYAYKEKVLCFSLKTSDYHEAIKKVRLEAAKVEQEFDELT